MSGAASEVSAAVGHSLRSRERLQQVDEPYLKGGVLVANLITEPHRFTRDMTDWVYLSTGPSDVCGIEAPAPWLVGPGWVAFDDSDGTGCAIRDDGFVGCWGDSLWGEGTAVQADEALSPP